MKGDVRDFITVVDIKRVNYGSVKALATVLVGGIEIRGVRVIQSNEFSNLWVAMPNKGRDEGYEPIVTITSKKFKNMISDVVLDSFNNVAPKRKKATKEHTDDALTLWEFYGKQSPNGGDEKYDA